MLDKEYILNLISKLPADNKLTYINKKIKYRGYEYLNLSEVNYIREKNNLETLDIRTLRDCLYNNCVSYRDIQQHTEISRAMMCMILRGTRNCSIKQINKIIKYLDEINIKFDWR